MENMIRALVVENQAIVRKGIVAILSFFDDIEVVGEAENGLQAIEQYKELQPDIDIVLLDLLMPELDGLATIPEIMNIAPKAQILVLTGHGNSERVYQAIRLGALGYLPKDTKPEELVKAIREVSRGEPVIPPSIAVRMIRESKPLAATHDTQQGNNNQLSELTPREIETLKCLAQGMTNQDIARKMVVNERTTAKYVSNILSKLHIENRTQAALYALEKGISSLETDKKDFP